MKASVRGSDSAENVPALSRAPPLGELRAEAKASPQRLDFPDPHLSPQQESFPLPRESEGHAHAPVVARMSPTSPMSPGICPPWSRIFFLSLNAREKLCRQLF
jgi:hypothetical protein